ncbi:hypothetical protein IX51_03880 [uncultured archaeon]|nr:hypothetical protein IX51_03880 [uncultured archaeon]
MTEPPNIVLVVLDTLRRSTLYDQINSTVAFKKIANDGVLYDNAISPASWTVPSHASIFSGLYPSEHGVHRRQEEGVMESMDRAHSMKDTLPERMYSAGYETTSLHANVLLSGGSGFDVGFDNCLSIGPFEWISAAGKSIKDILGDVDTQTSAALKHLILNLKFDEIRKILSINSSLRKQLKAKNFPVDKGGTDIVETATTYLKNSPSFVFMNFMESHGPHDRLPSNVLLWERKLTKRTIEDYTGDRPFKGKEVQRYRRSYHNSVQVMDTQLSKLVRKLEEKDLYDDTLLVITSDHGEALKENKFVGHGVFLHNTLINIPLMIKYPQSKKFKVENGYQTTIDMRDFLTVWSNGNKIPFPSRDVVFSEEFGSGHDGLSRVTDGRIDNVEDLNVKRKAVLKNGIKLVVDGTRGIVEEFEVDGIATSPKERREASSDLLEEMSIFTGNEDFIVPGN